MYDHGHDLQPIERELEERLARLIPEDQQAVIDEALALLTDEEKVKVLADFADVCAAQTRWQAGPCDSV